MQSRPSAPAIREWAKLPLTLRVAEVCGILRISERTLRQRLADGTMQPPPIPGTSPYTWSRDVLRAFIEGKAA
jgi:hypothetical protein